MKYTDILKHSYSIAVIFAILAAVCNSLDAPFIKIYTGNIGPFTIIAFLYLGSAIGMAILSLFTWKTSLNKKEGHVKKSDTPFLIGVTLSTLFAGISLCFGLQTTSASSASVLMSFETVVTVVLALLFLHEKVSKRLVIGVIFIVLGTIALSVKDATTFDFNTGSLFVIAGALFFGIRSILSKKIAHRNPGEPVIIRGIGVFICALPIGLALGESLPSIGDAAGLMLIGFITCGCMMFFTMLAQKTIGAAKTGAIFAIYPLIGAIIAFMLFGETPNASFIAALILILPGLYFVITRYSDTPSEPVTVHPSAVKDESPFFAAMSEEWRNQTRNFISAFGFLVMATPAVILLFNSFNMSGSKEMLSYSQDDLFIPLMVSALCLCICGICLLILRKRVLCGVTFFFGGLMLVFMVLFADNVYLMGLIGCLLVLFALILLTSNSHQKYIFALINGMYGLIVFLGIAGMSELIIVARLILLMLYCGFVLYLSVACASEKQSLPLKKYLTSNMEMDFRKCGPILGYFIIVLFIGWSVVYKFINIDYLQSDLMRNAASALIIVLFVIAFLLLFIGNMRFMPVMFMGIGFALLLETFCSGITLYVAPLVLLILSVYAVMRKYSYLLVSVFLIMLSFSMMLYILIPKYPEIMTAMLMIDVLCFGIAVYLAFAVFSEKVKLPLF